MNEEERKNAIIAIITASTKGLEALEEEMRNRLVEMNPADALHLGLLLGCTGMEQGLPHVVNSMGACASKIAGYHKEVPPKQYLN